MQGLLKIITESGEFTRILDKVRQGKPVDIFGATPSFKPYLLAALCTVPGRGLLWITSSWDMCEKIYENAHPFLPSEKRPRFQVFPEIATTGEEDITPALRMRTLELLADEEPVYMVAPFKSILQECEDPTDLLSKSIAVGTGKQANLEEVIARLEELGYSRNYQVERRGEYARRGGILDIYPATMDPVRIEFFGDTVESIRTIDIDSQVSTGRLDGVYIYPEREASRRSKLLDFYPENWIIVVDDPPVIKFQAVERNFEGDEELWEDLQFELRNRNPLNIMSWTGKEEGEVVFNTRPLDTRGGEIEKLLEDIRKFQRADERVVVSSQHKIRLRQVLVEKGIPGIKEDSQSALKPGEVLLLPGDFREGFLWVDQGLRFITDREILGASPRRRRVLRTWDRTKAVNLSDLNPGDRVVHLSHGIGIFKKLVNLDIQGITRDFVQLEYRGGDKLFLPVQQMDLLQKYTGPEGDTPKLSKLGGSDWKRTRSKARKAAQEIAEELINLYSEREQAQGHAFSPDQTWQWELESSFPYEETPDQDQVIDEIKKDQEAISPMDRLLCGDAGYGKTEVALRAAFKVVLDGKQVAFLAPTTVLAAQHFETFRQRLKPFPVKVAMLSRFKTRKEQKEIVTKLLTGDIDVVIGTHRLLQKDVKFNDLGLLIIDEEQHFGVKHKEKIKNLKVNVDVLTMSATPIPRTLHMSLSGIRDLSVINTPPEDRLPVKTYLYEYDPDLIRSAIIREIQRGGQVYFVHNRVMDIERVAQDIRRIVPFARVAVGHGQMDEHDLELLMLDFNEGAFDVLVCTTIIESGLDIPNVNTIIINNAQNFGLSQLYQLRGRVGRSSKQAYAYLLYPPHKSLTEEAQKRLEVIREFTHLGAGYQIALKDLEIRGAGNILGAEQSGYIAAVGFDLYCQLLREAVEEKRGIIRQRKIDPPRVDLPVDTYIPKTYISSAPVKMEMYRKISGVDKIEDIPELVGEFRDRFGPLPPPLMRLIDLLKIKLLAWDLGAPYVKEVKGKVHILLPGVKKFPLKRIQRIYEKTGVASHFHRALLILDDLLGKKKKTLGAEMEMVPPDQWIPKLETILKYLLNLKNKEKI